MIKSYLKEERIGKATKGIKKKIEKKTHDVKFSLLNEIPNIHILFENVIFVKFGGDV